MHQQADSGDVRDGVHGAHLVEVDLRDGHTVDQALRFGDQPIDRQDICPNFLRKVQVADDVLDIVHAAVMVVAMPVLMVVLVVVIVIMLVVVVMLVVMVVMVQALFLFPVHRHGDMSALDAALHRRPPGHMDPRNTQTVHLVQKRLLVRQQLQQGGGQHIACGTHSAVQIQCFHPFASIWLIIFAR